jgi:hypothetical protein
MPGKAFTACENLYAQNPQAAQRPGPGRWRLRRLAGGGGTPAAAGVNTVTIGTITYRVLPAAAADGVPYMLAEGIRWVVIASPARTPETVAGWITRDSRRRDRLRRGRYACYRGVDIEHLAGPDLIYLCNVRWPRRTGLPVVARAYDEWLSGQRRRQA